MSQITNAAQSIFIIADEGDEYSVWGPYPTVGHAKSKLKAGERIVDWPAGKERRIGRGPLDDLIAIGSVRVIRD